MHELLGGDPFPFLEDVHVTQALYILAHLEKLDEFDGKEDIWIENRYGFRAYLAHLEICSCQLYLENLIGIQKLIQRKDLTDKEKWPLAITLSHIWDDLGDNLPHEAPKNVYDALFDLYVKLVYTIKHSAMETRGLLHIADTSAYPTYQKGHDCLDMLSPTIARIEEIRRELFLRDPDPLVQDFLRDQREIEDLENNEDDFLL